MTRAKGGDCWAGAPFYVGYWASQPGQHGAQIRLHIEHAVVIIIINKNNKVTNFTSLTTYMSVYVGYICGIVDRQMLIIVGTIHKFLLHLFTDVVQCFNSRGNRVLTLVQESNCNFTPVFLTL